MTTPRTPRSTPEPATSRADTLALADSVGSTRIIALVAMLIAAVALGLAAWGFFAPGTPNCQQEAWDTAPADADIPTGWTVSASQYDLSRKTMSLLGPAGTDENATQAVVYATITCFGQGAAESVTLSEQAATDAGQAVTDRDDLGEQAYSATDESGAVFLQLRHGPIVVYLAASGDTQPAEVDQLASAFDKALGGDGGAISVATQPAATDDTAASEDPFASEDPLASDEIGLESPAAPAMEAVLPAKVGDIEMSLGSAVGSDILAEDDQWGRTILAALRADGKTAEALTAAQAYDATESTDLSLLAVAVEGMAPEKVEALVIDGWLTASGSGVTSSPVTLGDTEWTEYDYGDDGPKDYVRTQDGTVIVITTADPALAAEAAAALP